MPAGTLALCVSWLSYPHQALLSAPLSQIGDAVAASGLTPPALLVVGDVVAFWQRLQGRQQDVNDAVDQQHVSAIFDEIANLLELAAGRPISHPRLPAGRAVAPVH